MSQPERPEHHDFTRLMVVVNEADDQSDDHKSLEEVMVGIADVESVAYMAMQRALRAVDMLPPVSGRSNMMTTIAAAWFDAFRAGVRFQQEGGHDA